MPFLLPATRYIACSHRCSGTCVVEADETYIGRKEGHEKQRRAFHHKVPVLSLVHRESGEARSFVIDKASKESVVPIVMQNVHRETYILTDEAHHYTHSGFRDVFPGHGRVNHAAGEYGRGRIHATPSKAIIRSSSAGCGASISGAPKKHLHRYLAEFDFRYSNRAALDGNDSERADRLLRGTVGKRLTYRACV